MFKQVLGNKDDGVSVRSAAPKADYQDIPTDQTLLERTQAFVELRFPNLIKDLKSVKNEKEVHDRSVH
jgi:hypothetical protein